MVFRERKKKEKSLSILERQVWSLGRVCYAQDCTETVYQVKRGKPKENTNKK